MPDPTAEILPPIRHPARFVPLSALALGAPGETARVVGPDNPLPSREQPLQAARPLTPGSAVAPGAALLIDCQSGGQASFTLAAGTSLTLTLSPGLTLLPLAVSQLGNADLTAVLDAWVLD